MSTNLAFRQDDLFGRVSARQKPFLKWAGGKFRVLEEILHRLPTGARLVEPFAGSAAVALNACFADALVADSNEDLINLYQSIQADTPRFLQEAKELFVHETNTREFFDALRKEFNESSDPFRRSVIFVYLNRHGFNGLCRYNGKGKFNVPFGKYTKPGFPFTEIIAFGAASQRIEFRHQDFLTTMSSARLGDVVYCDPPYVPLSVTSNFTSYAPGSFGFAEQRALAEMARDCAARGIPVVISNHDTADSRALYAGAEIHSFEVQRFISSKASTRGNAPELLAIFRC
jgi:DNA adenine methylase